jgi:hypothetical protein
MTEKTQHSVGSYERELLEKHQKSDEAGKKEVVEQLKKLALMYPHHPLAPRTAELIGGRPEPEVSVEEVPHPVAGLMGQIYCWVAGKAPKTDKWNLRQNLLTLQQIQEGPRPSWATGYGMVSGRYSGFLCVDVDTKPARPEQPNTTFRRLYKRNLADLPPSATVISGKPNRWRAYFRVPSEWWPDLSGYSVNEGDLEMRWEDGDPGAPAAKQSVISGPHPDGGDLHFRWREGNRPEDVGIADCPVWLLRGMALDHLRRQINEEAGPERKAAADGEPTHIEKLMPKEQVELLQEMSKFWPYRGGLAGTRFQASYGSDNYNSLLGALFNLFGDELALLYLSDTEWFKNSEGFGNNEDFNKALRSVGKSKTAKEAGWGTLYHLATRTEQDGVQFEEPAFKWPKNLHPPIEVRVNDMAKRTVEMLSQLKEAMEIIEMMPTVLERTIAYQNLQTTLGCTSQQYRELLKALEMEKRPRVGGSLSEVCANAKDIRAVIERLLPENCITIIASESGVGKSALIYRMAVAGAYGGKLFGQLQAEQGNVLIVQTDESDSNLKSKIQKMDIADPEKRIRVEFQFSAGHFPELRNWIREHKAKYVLMDSLGSLFAGEDISANMIGTYIYNLNDIAAEEGCAIVLTHHLRKQAKEKAQRTTVTMGDLYGNQYITAGASDVWGITRDPESDPANPQFVLKVIKPRSSVTQGGDEFRLSGNLDDLSFDLASLNGDKEAVKTLSDMQEKVHKSCKGRTLETGLTKGELMAGTGASEATVRRVTDALVGRGLLNRGKRGDDKGGRPSFVFWA